MGQILLYWLSLSTISDSWYVLLWSMANVEVVSSQDMQAVPCASRHSIYQLFSVAYYLRSVKYP